MAATYFHFLLFTEFALLELAGGETPRAQAVLACLAVGGLGGSTLAARRFSRERFARTLGWSLVLGGLLASAAPLWAPTPAAWAFAAGSGALAGVATVTLASGLGSWAPPARLGRAVGTGTGLAYACANLPPVFQASAAGQCLVAAAVSVAGGLLCLAQGAASREPAARRVAPSQSADPLSAAAVVALFFALVWTDSAAFFAIQHTPSLLALSWGGPAALWGNAAMHLAAACAAGVLLDRGGARPLLAGAWLALTASALLIQAGGPSAAWGRWGYTAGVSLYSTALVWWAAREARPWFTALLFGAAGWIASGMGIGMVQHLTRIPWAFVLASGGLFLVALLRVRMPAALAAALALALLPASRTRAADAGDAGREVYIAEGCIECHSQFLRAGAARESSDWGPAAPVSAQEQGTPPLIGNRRMGPDLSRVGLRRSREWNRLHLVAPRAIDRASCMPSYARLFRAGDPRGPALLDFLDSLGRGAEAERSGLVASWSPAPGAQAAPPDRARRLWTTLCAGCHGAKGRGDGPLAPELSLKPPDFSAGAWRHFPGRQGAAVPTTALARLVKFGVVGTPMAGHEYLSDADLLALAEHVRTLHAAVKPRQHG